MADVDSEIVPLGGLNATANPASPGGDTVPVDSLVRVINGDISPHTMTLVTPGTVTGLGIDDRGVAIPAGEALYVPVPRVPYRDPATGRASITWDDTTGMSFEVLRS